MLAIERTNARLAKLAADGSVSVSELSRDFGVAEETIRRDLEKLACEGLVIKIHGGAVAAHGLNTDLPYNVRKSSNVEQKCRIAELIAGLIPDGSFLMLDSSSTAKFVTKYISERKNITIITNSVEILFELNTKGQGWNVLSTGGTLKQGALSLVGTSAQKMIESYHTDFAICSAKGVDLERGVTDSNDSDVLIKQAMFASAGKKILAVDSSKLNKISFVRVCDFEETDMLVTDKNPGETWLERLNEAGVRVLY